VAQHAFVGREAELGRLDDSLSRAASGKSQVVVVSGEPGIGKSRLLEEVKSRASKAGFSILAGGCPSEGAAPLQPLSKALGTALFEAGRHVSFDFVMLLDDSGSVAARSSASGSAEGYAKVLSAVQGFVKDSFAGAEGSLGKLEFGETKIVAERFGGGALVAAFRGPEHEDMRRAVKAAARRVSELVRGRMDDWMKNESMAHLLEVEARALASARFRVRRSLEGVKLQDELNRISESLLCALASLSSAKPVLLVVEDIHWADDSTLFALEYLARNLSAERILIAATMRKAEGGRALKAVERMREGGAISEVVVRPIDEPGTKALLDALFSPNRFPAGLAGKLAADCRGNPFFLTELLCQMQTDGAVAIDDGIYSLTERAVTVPTTIEEMAQRRMDGLSPESMSLAEYASCIGREFQVEEAFSFGGIAYPGEALAGIESSGIIITSGGRSEFSHALLQDAVYKHISPRWKAAYHKSLGEHYELRFEGRESEAAYELARHFSLTSEHSKACGYCVTAGEKADAAYAVGQALELYSKALSLLPKVRGERPDESALRERLGDLLVLDGRFDEALDSFGLAGEAGAGGETRARMKRRRCSVYLLKGDYERGEAEARIGEALAPGTAEAWRLVHQRAVILQSQAKYSESTELCTAALRGFSETGGTKKDAAAAKKTMGQNCWFTGEYDRALEFYAETRKALEEAGDRRALASIDLNIGVIYLEQGKHDRSLAVFEDAIETCKATGDQPLMASAWGNVGVARQRMGDYPKGLEAMERSYAIYARLGDRWGMARSLGNIGVVLSETGELRRALDAYTSGLGLMESVGSPQGVGVILYFIGSLRLETGDLAEAESDMRRSLEILEKIGDRQRAAACREAIATALRDSGRLDEAQPYYAAALAAGIELGDAELKVSISLNMAELCIAKGDFAQARTLCEKAGEDARASVMKTYEARSDALLGSIESFAGRPDESEARVAAALASFVEMKAETEAPKTRCMRGEALARRGDTRARGELEAALADLERRGMRLWAARCKMALEGMG
jgi:tetratricopeptide (TPR) repeat protein